MAASNPSTLQDFEWAIGMNLWSLKMCGIWCDENNSYWLNAIANVFLPLYGLIIVGSLIPQTCALLKVWGNMTLAAENLILSLPFTIILFEISIMRFKKEVVVTMMISIRDDWTKVKSEEERNKMIKYAQASRMITFGGFSTITAAFFAYNLPIFFGDVPRTLNNITDAGYRPLLLQSVYFYDVYETPIYELTIISQVAAFGVAGFCYTTVGTLLGTIALHVCSQLENLAVRFQCIFGNDKKTQNTFKKFISSNVEEHQRLIRFADMIEDTFSMILLVIMPVFTLMFCVQGLTLIDVMTSDVKGPVMTVAFGIVHLCFITFVMFFYSLVGQALETKSEEIQYAAYNCEWHELQPKEVAMLILILIRAQRPLRITAGKFAPLSMNTFASFLKTGAGYLSCLLAVRES